nr:PKD domain-containing protein [Acidimicrobiia bacterium]
GTPTSWEWQFPDGTTSNEQHPQLPVGASGLVTLTVSNGTSTDRTSTDIGYVEC